MSRDVVTVCYSLSVFQTKTTVLRATSLGIFYPFCLESLLPPPCPSLAQHSSSMKPWFRFPPDPGAWVTSAHLPCSVVWALPVGCAWTGWPKAVPALRTQSCTETLARRVRDVFSFACAILGWLAQLAFYWTVPREKSLSLAIKWKKYLLCSWSHEVASLYKG